MSPEVTLRHAVRADIAAIMAIERRPGFESLISRSSLGEHEAMLASPEYAYFVGLDAQGEVVAFAILRDLEDRYGNLYLKRIAVFEPGAGVGFAFMTRSRTGHSGRPPRTASGSALSTATRGRNASMKSWASAAMAFARGLSRHGRATAGLTLMALLRPEWEARTAAAPQDLVEGDAARLRVEP